MERTYFSHAIARGGDPPDGESWMRCSLGGALRKRFLQQPCLELADGGKLSLDDSQQLGEYL